MNVNLSDSFYPIYNASPVTAVQKADLVTAGTEGPVVTEGVKKTECQTCKSRTYVDGSNESNVSFKAPGHIDPSASAAVVMGHEQEHVANARSEGSEPNKQLVSASVSLQVSVCPECGRSYVSGGKTTSTIATTYNQSSPYDQVRKSIEGNMLAGSYIDTVA